MDEVIKEKQKVPGIVIFAAILNFIVAAYPAVVFLLALVGMVFGQIVGVYDFAARHLAQVYPMNSIPFYLNLIFGMLFLSSLVFLGLLLWTGIGLLRAKKYAWYMQITMSILWLVVFPLGTFFSLMILIFFFQQPVRDFFDV